MVSLSISLFTQGVYIFLGESMTDDNGAVFSQELLDRMVALLERVARAQKRNDEILSRGIIIRPHYARYLPDPIDFKEISNVDPPRENEDTN